VIVEINTVSVEIGMRDKVVTYLKSWDKTASPTTDGIYGSFKSTCGWGYKLHQPLTSITALSILNIFALPE
jgi:hypothetical protein